MPDDLTPEEWEAFRNSKATWQKDGLGLRGEVVQVSNTKANLVWESKISYRRPDLNVPTTSQTDRNPEAID